MVKKNIAAVVLFVVATASLVLSISPKSASAAYIDDISRVEAIECLAKNIYFESANESLTGQISVGMVVLNRVNDSRYPKKICDVVYQGKFGTNERAGRILHQCQFSWACDGKSDNIPDLDKLNAAFNVAELVYNMYKNGYDITDGATHYHASYVNPAWNKDRNMKRIATIDNHVFYRWGS